MNLFTRTASLLFAVSITGFAAPTNIVVIVVDDVGYGDIGAFIGGGVRGIPTPNLDRMAAEGRRFTAFYGHPFCTPTRASLMTGRLPIRAGFEFPLFPGLPGGLHPDEVTIAEVLGETGYESAVIGKWHLGDQEPHLPHNQGFDEFWGFLYHCDAYLYPTDRDWTPDSPAGRMMKVKGVVEGRKGEPSREVEPIDAKRLETLDRDIALRAANYISDHAERDAPFFLVVGFAKAHYVNFPHPEFVGKSRAGVYGDAVVELDHHTGMVLDAVREAEIAEDTLVVWLSDNGPSYDTFPDCGYSPFKGGKGETFEGGVRLPLIAWWPETIPAGTSSEGIITAMDLFSTFAALGGGTVPADRPIDGNDQVAFLKGEAESATETVYYYLASELTAIRHGKWKVHFATVENTPEGPIERYVAPKLFDLLTDPRESTNLVYTKTWAVVEANLLMRQHLAEMKRFPNRVIVPPMN